MKVKTLLPVSLTFVLFTMLVAVFDPLTAGKVVVGAFVVVGAYCLGMSHGLDVYARVVAKAREDEDEQVHRERGGARTGR